MKTKKRPSKPRADKAATEIVAYKGLDANFKCRDHQYVVGENYHHTGNVKCCESGFHSCEYPLDTFNYYSPSTSKFARVLVTGTISRHSNDSKIACASIKIEAEIHIPELVTAAINYTLSRLKKSKLAHKTGNRSASSATGDYSASSATGDYSASSATGHKSASSATGYNSASSATGDKSASSATGYNSASSATGYSSASSATGYNSASSATGDKSASSATGDYSASSATGYNSASSATGDYSASLATGDYGTARIETLVGEIDSAVAVATGYKSKAKASAGSAIVCVYRTNNGDLVHIRAGIAGKDVKPDTWYMLDKDGNFVEIVNENA